MSPVNTDEPEWALMLARQRVLKIQTKLHCWARDDPHRRFDDLFTVADPAFLLVAWDRVSGNTGAATAGVDRRTASSIVAADGVEVFLDDLRSAIKDRSFHLVAGPRADDPQNRREVASVGHSDRDRSGGPGIVEGAGADLRSGFLPCSYGFRPRRRAHDAVAEVRYLATRPRCYEWVVEGDIKACFDEIDHTALMGRVASTRRGYPRPGLGQGVPEGGHPHRGGPAGRQHRGNSAGWDPLAVVGQCGVVGAR